MKVNVRWSFGSQCFCVKQEDGQVIAWARAVSLVNVAFKIDQAKQYEARKTGMRNQHAWAEGFLVDYIVKESFRVFVDLPKHEAIYDPFTHDEFIDKETGAPVRWARVVVLQDKRIFYGG